MLLSSVFRSLIKRRLISISRREISTKRFDAKEDKAPDKSDTPNLGEIGRKYRVFREEESETILDVNEERLKYSELLEEDDVEEIDPYKGINLQRGKTGVFDIEDLVHILQIENSEDIFVALVPSEIKYVDYICIVSAKSHRHMLAIIQFIRKVYKQKRGPGDTVPRTEGGESKDWIALDLGNIALHVMSRKARSLYDLDSLWAVGPKFDNEYNKKDPVADMLEEHSIYLQNLETAR